MAVWAEVLVLSLAAYGLGLVSGWLLLSAPVRMPRRPRRENEQNTEN